MTLDQAIAEINRLHDALFARGQIACTPAEFQTFHQAWLIVQTHTQPAADAPDA